MVQMRRVGAAAAVAPASMFLLLILARHFCWRWMGLRMRCLRHMLRLRMGLRMRCLRHMLRLRMICLRMRGLRHMMRLRMVRLRMRLLGDVLWSRASLLFEMRFRGAFYMVRGLRVGCGGRMLYLSLHGISVFLFWLFDFFSCVRYRLAFFSLRGQCFLVGRFQLAGGCRRCGSRFDRLPRLICFDRCLNLGLAWRVSDCG